MFICLYLMFILFIRTAVLYLRILRLQSMNVCICVILLISAALGLGKRYKEGKWFSMKYKTLTLGKKDALSQVFYW